MGDRRMFENEISYIPIRVKRKGFWENFGCYIEMFKIKFNYNFNIPSNNKREMNQFCYIAAAYGDVDMLIYFRNIQLIFPKDICVFASLNEQHLEVLKYLHENGCPWNEKCTTNAYECDHRECLKYLFKHNCPRKLS